jgi:hypothetical protein
MSILTFKNFMNFQKWRKKMQISVVIDDDLRAKIDRQPRSKNVSEDTRIFLRAMYSTREEMSQWCRENEDRARAAQQMVMETFENLKALAEMEIGKK